jgi:hypothetical protein
MSRNATRHMGTKRASHELARRFSQAQGATRASHGLAREGQPRNMSRRMPAQCAPHEARWAGQDARIQRFIVDTSHEAQ